MLQSLQVFSEWGREEAFSWPEKNSVPLLPVNIRVNLIFDALTLAYARESFKIGYSICISEADGVKEQT